uniref:Myomesin 2 n=1 Tax=Takifugu rubripes TaxID=31033 RepID=A0A674PGX9_TAKRU
SSLVVYPFLAKPHVLRETPWSMLSGIQTLYRATLTQQCFKVDHMCSCLWERKHTSHSGFIALLCYSDAKRPLCHLNEVYVQIKKKRLDKYVYEGPMIRGPHFLVRLRSHTVFENTSVKLFCTVDGFPMPTVKWYKDDVILDVSSGRYLLDRTGGIHSLEILRCCTDDTAQYTVVATNSHGQASCQAAVLVKRLKQEEDSCPYTWLPFTAAMLPQIHYTKINVTFREKFGPVFATEGESATLSATVTLNPNLANLQPEAQWYRDETRLFDSKWVKIETGRGISTLTLPQLYKDDEGLYTLRMVTKGGTAEHSAFVSVSDGPPPVPNAPGAPMDMMIHDANRDYVIVSWKPPNTTTEGPILGYFVDKCEVGTDNWSQCNDHPIKICKYPVSGLFEGHSYYFRVRAVNSHGISKASRMSDAIAALDPSEFGKLHAKKLGGKLEVVSFDDDLEADGKPPAAPAGVYASETDRTYVVLSWKAPSYSSKAPMWYYIEKGGAWQRVNTQVPIRSPRYAVFDLAEGKQYQFRVLSANIYGNSEPSECAIRSRSGTQQSNWLLHRSVLCLGPTFDSALSQLYFICDGHSMLLTWKKPLFSGGSKIKEYYVDKRRSGTTTWREVHIPPVSERVYKVEGLTAGAVYQFQVYAANLAGLGPASKHSDDFTCEGWTMPEPGPAYDLTLTEVRDHSMVVEWKKPVYSGSGPITGYHVEYCKTGSSEWTTATETAVHQRFFKVCLEEGVNYEFRVRGVNEAGVGVASMPSDPVPATSLAGIVSSKMDKKTGDIVLSFESCVMNQGSQFIWKKDYEEITDFSTGMVVKTEGNTSKLIFKNAAKEDFGVYSVSVTNSDGASSSYGISAEELTKMLALSYDIRHPIIPLKSELAYKILERGRVRFWLQAEEISANVTYKFFANNKELCGAEMGHDVSTGIIDFVLDHFTEENQGTFTCQLTDGGGKAQSSLVLIGDGENSQERRLQLSEYLQTNEEDEEEERPSKVLMMPSLLQVANLKKESEFHWFKEEAEIIPDVKPDLGSGLCRLPIKLFSLKTSGIYKATISDDRGKDMSQLDVSGKVFDDAINKLSQLAGASAAELVIKCTATGIQLQCHMKYYTSEMNITWYHGETKLIHSDKIEIGGTPSMATMEVIEPTEKDQGKYSIVIVDPENSHKRTLDLSGEGAALSAHAEFLKLKNVCVLDRGKVVGGLPDVATIMEKKTLSLTCTVCGDPKPQVSWLKSGAEYVVSLDQGRFASLTIKGVSLEDSGRYTMIVQNKYGGESVDIVVSVALQCKGQDFLSSACGANTCSTG